VTGTGVKTGLLGGLGGVGARAGAHKYEMFFVWVRPRSSQFGKMMDEHDMVGDGCFGDEDGVDFFGGGRDAGFYGFLMVETQKNSGHRLVACNVRKVCGKMVFPSVC